MLAIDESTGTCNIRFAAEGIPQTIEMRRKYREMIVLMSFNAQIDSSTSTVLVDSLSFENFPLSSVDETGVY